MTDNIISMPPDILKIELHNAVDRIFQVQDQRNAEIKKQKDVFQTHMENCQALVSGYSPPPIIVINVGGSNIRMTRAALTSFSGSRLAWIFNGRWDHMLPRDETGRIFLDLDSKWVAPIFEALTEIDNTNECTPEDLQINSSHLSGDDRLGFEACMELFGLVLNVPRAVQHRIDMRTQVQKYLKSSKVPKTLVNFKFPHQWDLIYSSTVSNIGMDAFQQACSNKKNIIVLIQDIDSKIYGFFTGVGFQSTSEGRTIQDISSFAFDITDTSKPTTVEMSRVRSKIDSSLIIQGETSSLYFMLIGDNSEPLKVSCRFRAPSLKTENRKETPVKEIFVWQIPTQNSSAVNNSSSSSIVVESPEMSQTYIKCCDLMAPPIEVLGPQLQQWIKNKESELNTELEEFEKQTIAFRNEHSFIVGFIKNMSDAEARKRVWLSRCSLSMTPHKDVSTKIPSCTPDSNQRRMESHRSDGLSLFTPYKTTSGYSETVRIACAGGGPEFCTMRSTFQQFPNTPLATKYASDTWEENLAVGLDEEGCVIEDHNPECFRKLLNVMRLRSLIRDAKYESKLGCSVPCPMRDRLKQKLSSMLQYLLIDESDFFGRLDGITEQGNVGNNKV